MRVLKFHFFSLEFESVFNQAKELVEIIFMNKLRNLRYCQKYYNFLMI